jgi:hypothetical protein
MKTQIAKAKGATGQTTYAVNCALSIDGDSVRIDASVKNSAAFANKRFYVVLCEAYHWYNAAGTNGEKNFYFIARKFMADTGCVRISGAANATVARSYATYLNPEWYSDMLYAVAFVQDDVTKEVHQVGVSTMPNLTGVTSRPRQSATIAQDPTYNLIKRNTAITKTIAIANTNSVDLTCKILTSPSSDMPKTWTCAVTPNVITIPANSSMNVDLTLTPDGKPGYTDVTIGVYPVNQTDAFPLPIFHHVYFLTEKIKLGLFTGGSAYLNNDMYHQIYTSAYSQNFYNESAIVPLNDVTMTKFPLDNYDFASFFFDMSTNNLSSGPYSKTVIGMVKDMMTAGKKVWISSWVDHWLGLQSTADAEVKDFFTNYIGIDTALTVENNPYFQEFYQDEYGNIIFYSYNVNGVVGDIIGSGMAVNATQRTADWGGATLFTCPMIPRTGSNAIPFDYMEDNTDLYLGIHKKIGNGKLVYTSIGIEGMSTDGSRQDYLDRVLGWLDPLDEAGAKIICDVQDITFLDMSINDTKTQKIKITNGGTKDLVISDYKFINDDAALFQVFPAFTAPITLAPEASAEFTVQFTAHNSGSFDTQLSFTSNATNSPTFNITILAEVQSSGSGAQIATDAVAGVLDFGEVTPKVTATKVLKITNSGDESLNITMVDFPNDSRGLFNYPQGTSFPFTIEKSKSRDFTVVFRDNNQDESYNADMIITSNAKNSPTLTVKLTAKTTKVGVTESISEDGLFTMNATPNPASEKSMISMKLSGTTPRNVTVYAIDVTGSKIANIYSATMNPGESVNQEFNLSAIASGKYFIVANVDGMLVQVPVVVEK